MAPYAPMKAVHVAEPFSDPAWLFERKLDGARAGVMREGAKNVRLLPLRERKRRLRGAVRLRDRLRWTPYRIGDGEAAYRDACAHGWEGVVAKRADSPYVPVRSRMSDRALGQAGRGSGAGPIKVMWFQLTYTIRPSSPSSLTGFG